jgi:hypothetical protein
MKQPLDLMVFFFIVCAFVMLGVSAFDQPPEICPKHMDNWKCEPGETMRILVRYSDHTPFISCSRDHEVPENAHIAESEP